MKNKIEKFLNDYNLTNKEAAIAVGFSGGYDSMALLDALNKLSKKYGFKVIAAHLNHNWRGKESELEQTNCRNFCEQNNIEFYSETLDENEKHTEVRARELRYEFFNRVIKKYNASALLTAHTKSDTAETLIYREIKGTGIKGLQGISPKLGKIYRPMLSVSRLETEAYCRENNLKPNNDSSNEDIKYARNFIRHKILPAFKKINPKAEDALNNLSILAFEEEQIIKEYINSLNIYDGNRIKTKTFNTLSNILQKRIIYEIYVKYDIEYTQERIENTLKFVKENINSKSGKKYSVNSQYFLFVNANYIELISNYEKSEQEVKITKEGSYNFGEYEFTIEACDKIPETYPKDSEYKAFIEIKDNVDYTLRTRRTGDRIQPLGFSGTIKLKKYLINKNIPQHKKDSIILLCKDTEVLWASGLGISDKIKVVNKCTHVLTLKKIR